MKSFYTNIPKFIVYLLFSAVIIFYLSCNKKVSGSNEDNLIKTFTLTDSNNNKYETSMESSNDTIYVQTDANANIQSIKAVYTFNGKSAYPQSGSEFDFSKSQKIGITCNDGTIKNYNVVVNYYPVKNILFFGASDNNFYALDASTGNLVWEYSGSNSFVYSSPIYNNGVIYTGSIDNNVYAFNPRNGNIIWKKLVCSDGTGIESDAVVSGDFIYVGANDDYLYVLNKYNGDIVWKFKTGGNVSSSPCIVKGTVYFGSSDCNGTVYALDSSSGNLKWQYQTGGMINQSGCSVVNNTLYVGSRSGFLYALDATTGSLKWKYSANNISLEQSSPTVANGVVYIGGWYNIADFSQAGAVYAVDALSGTPIWTKLVGQGFSSSPYVDNNRLFITSDDLNIYALNTADGSTIWKKRIIANGSSPLARNGIVYCGGGGSRYFYALDASSGDVIWQFPLPQLALDTSNPLLVDVSSLPVSASESGSTE